MNIFKKNLKWKRKNNNKKIKKMSCVEDKYFISYFGKRKKRVENIYIKNFN